MKGIIRQWRRMLARLCSPDIKSVIEKTVTGDSISKSIGLDMPERPAVPRCQWYRVDRADHKIDLTVPDDVIVPVQYRCMICDHPYIVPIKAWKIRSCHYIAAPCKKCNTFQTVDMAELREGYRTEPHHSNHGIPYVAVTSVYGPR